MCECRYTPEGIDQNPVYYEFMTAASFRGAPVANLTAWAIDRAYRRYGLTGAPGSAPAVDAAWAALVNSTYSQDLSVQDGTGVAHLPGWDRSQFEPDLRTPTPRLCATWHAWGALLDAAPGLPDAALETYTYDLVNLGRELLAQLSTPRSVNFSTALRAVPLVPEDLTRAGDAYAEVLTDLDALVGTHYAFLVGPWLRDARAWGANSSDCGDLACPDFYEWNARCQVRRARCVCVCVCMCVRVCVCVCVCVCCLSTCAPGFAWSRACVCYYFLVSARACCSLNPQTRNHACRAQWTTWNPTPAGAAKIPDGPNDYAARHYNGLINDYYVARARATLKQALVDAEGSGALNGTAIDRIYAGLAYEWTTSTAPYPTSPVGDPLTVSADMRSKYAYAYAPYCG